MAGLHGDKVVRRVVSLLPSATEILCLIGAEHLLVGRSHECDWPPSIRDRPALTGAHNQFENSQQMHDAVTESLSAGKVIKDVAVRKCHMLRFSLITEHGVCVQVPLSGPSNPLFFVAGPVYAGQEDAEGAQARRHFDAELVLSMFS